MRRTHAEAVEREEWKSVACFLLLYAEPHVSPVPLPPALRPPHQLMHKGDAGKEREAARDGVAPSVSLQYPTPRVPRGLSGYEARQTRGVVFGRGAGDEVSGWVPQKGRRGGDVMMRGRNETGIRYMSGGSYRIFLKGNKIYCER